MGAPDIDVIKKHFSFQPKFMKVPLAGQKLHHPDQGNSTGMHPNQKVNRAKELTYLSINNEFS
jgi:hypothetical protein